MRQRRSLESTETDEQAAAAEAELLGAQRTLLQKLQRYCTTATCRHKTLSEYFGQPYEPANCRACDICLSEVEVTDGTVTAQKILSCVARTDQRFGVGHVVDVLLGADTEMIRRCGHNKLSTYGLLKEMAKKQLQAFVYQLVDHELLERTEGERPILQLNEASWEVMRGTRSVGFARATKQSRKKTRHTGKGMTSEAKRLAFKLLAEGRTLDEVRQKIERAHSTTIEYLADFIATEKPASIESWIAASLYQRIAEAIAGVQKHAPPEEAWRLSPIFAALDRAVPYEDIRLVVAHMRAVRGE